MLNEYQQFNVKKGKENDEKLDGWGFMGVGDFKCIKCGGKVSPATVDYFNREVTKFLCYKCQNINN